MPLQEINSSTTNKDPINTFGKYYDSKNQIDDKIRDLQSKFEEASLRNMNYFEENSTLRKNSQNIDTFRLENEKLRKANQDFVIVNERLQEELKDTDTNENRLTQQVRLITRRLCNYITKIDKSIKKRAGISKKSIKSIDCYT